MKLEVYTVSDLPVVVIDDFYNTSALKKVWSEILFLSSGDKLKDPEDTGSAFDNDSNGKLLKKKNKGAFLDEVYFKREFSDILEENKKMWSGEFIDALIEVHPFFRYLTVITRDHTLLSYYEDSDYYAAHKDEAIISVCNWFYKGEKEFSGGSLTFDNKLTIDCKHNRSVIFPSILFHEVDPVILPQEKKNSGLGRYTLTQLLTQQS
jgi:hypothetical protein